MTVEEFSNAFDTLLNSYSTQSLFGDTSSLRDITLDEYEKSLFLTQAQEQLVVELYTGRNTKGEPFEGTEELRSNLKDLIKTDVLEEDKEGHKGLSRDSKFFKAPDDVLFITYEYAVINDESSGCKNGSEILIIPVTQDDFNRMKNNPFKGPSDKRALRLDNSNNILEVVSKYNIKDYTIRYLSKPTPIILADLDGVSINECSTVTQCMLNSAMHRPILERAVMLAISSRGSQKSNV